MIIRTFFAISLLFLFSHQGYRDQKLTNWLFYDLNIFVSWGEAESFTRILNWTITFLFIASCFFCT